MRCIRRDVSTTPNKWGKIVLYSTNNHKPWQTIANHQSRSHPPRLSAIQTYSPSKPIAARCRFVGSHNWWFACPRWWLARTSKLGMSNCGVLISHWGQSALIVSSVLICSIYMLFSYVDGSATIETKNEFLLGPQLVRFLQWLYGWSFILQQLVSSKLKISNFRFECCWHDCRFKQYCRCCSHSNE